MKKVLFLSAIILLVTNFLVSGQEKKDSLKLIRLQEVNIISTRAVQKTPIAYSNVNKEDLQKQNLGQDMPTLLLLTPSVVITSEAGTGIGYTGFRIRGTDANRINISANGVPMNDAESQSIFWVNIPDFSSTLENLQVQRGVGTSTNGSGAFGASINMKTENIPSQSYGELNGSYGSFNTSKATVKFGTGLLNNHWAFDARLSNIYSDGYVDRASADLKSFFTQAAYYTENTMLKLVVFGGKEKTYQAWYGVPLQLLKTDRTYNPCGEMGLDENNKMMFYNNQTDNYTQTNYQLAFFHEFNSALKLDASLHYTKGKGYYEEYKQDQLLTKYGLVPYAYDSVTIYNQDLIRQKWLDNDFYGGIFSLNYKQGKWDATIGGGANNYNGNHFGNILWVKNYIGNLLPEQEYYRSTSNKTDANIYMKTNYALSSKINAYIDLQYRFIDYRMNGINDKWDKKTKSLQALDMKKIFNFFNPKAGVFYQPNKQNDLYISFATGHREPNRNNYTDAGPNEKPTFETLYDYEAGYTFKHEAFSAGINLYYMKYKNQLVLTGKISEIGEPLTSNIPDSYRMGAEIMAGVRITPWLKWNGNVTLSKNEIHNFTEYVEDWDTGDERTFYLGTTPLSFSPNIIANSLFSFSYKKWDAAFQSNFVGKQYIDNTGNEERKLDPYFVNNLRFGYTFQLKSIKSLGINFLINNIFNEQYESNAYVYSYFQNSERKANYSFFPQAGMNVLANIALKF